MLKNSANFFVDDNYFISFDASGAVNNIITIGGLKFSKPSDGTNGNPVYCSFRGEYLTQIKESELDTQGNEDSFAYITLPNFKNVVKLAVSKTTVTDLCSAIKYVKGMFVEYQLTELSVAGTCKDPLYEVSTRLSNGSIVSSTISCSLADVARKIQALETNFDINESGYYEHIVRIALVQK